MDFKKVEDEKKVIAAFDFDGTIIKKDSLPHFIRFSASTLQFLFRSLKMIPYLILFKLKIIPNFKAKEKLFKTFFAGISLNNFDEISHRFAPKIDQMVNLDALERIKWHQLNGHEVIIISASVENWIKPWADKYGIKTILATRLQLKNNLVTGNFLTKNCHGVEKVNRLLENYPQRSEYILYAYGDSGGDKNLLAEADFPFYRTFK